MIAVAVSGGMDSLYALRALHAAGKRVIALHGLFLPNGDVRREEGAAPGLARFCAANDIPFHCIDLVEEFERRVIEPFCAAYAAGLTPNPCAACNPAIKFGALWDAARELGANGFCTGHYVRMRPHPALSGSSLESWHLPAAAADQGKDQSYFLALTPIERLQATLFPLGGLTKADIAAELKAHGITPPVPGESQDICFVPRNDYRAFLESRPACATCPSGVSGLSGSSGLSGLSGPGPIVDSSGKRLGTHQGLWNHTEGQRRGLGIAAAYPLYVIRKDVGTNTLFVGGKDESLCEELTASGLNCMLPPRLWKDLWKELGPGIAPAAGIAPVAEGAPIGGRVPVAGSGFTPAPGGAPLAPGSAPHGEYFVRVRYRQAAQPATVEIEGDTLRVRFKTPQPLPAAGQIAAVYDRQGFLLAGGIIC